MAPVYPEHLESVPFGTNEAIGKLMIAVDALRVCVVVFFCVTTCVLLFAVIFGLKSEIVESIWATWATASIVMLFIERLVGSRYKELDEILNPPRNHCGQSGEGGGSW